MLLQGLSALVCFAIGAGAGYFLSRRHYLKLLSASTGNAVNSHSPANAPQALASNDDQQVNERRNRIETTHDELPSATELPRKKEEPIAAATIKPSKTAPQSPPSLNTTSQEIAKHREPAQAPSPPARTDALTLMLNRQAFSEELAPLLGKSQTDGSSGVLLMVDIDHLQQVNNRYGNAVGNKALQHVARTLRNTLLGLDVATARFGGEEIAAFLTNTSMANAKALAEEIRAAVEQNTIKNDAESIAITVSIGLADAEARLRLDQLVARAMQAVYAAKAAGCNRVFLHNGRECVSLDEKAPVGTNAKTANEQPSVSAVAAPARPAAIAGRGSEQRAHRRQKFGGMHCVAPYLNGQVPTPDMFYAARFSDISSGGFSMLLPKPPECQSFVVALSKGNGTIYVAAEVVRTRESTEAGERLFTVGCRFTGRIEVDCINRAAQAV